MDYKYRITIFALLINIFHTYGLTCTSPTIECPCEETDQLKTINCRYQGLTSIPSFQDTSILYDKIVFTSTEATGTCHSGNNCNNILSLPANAFANLNVKSIDLRNNAIVTFHPDAFKGTRNVLESLYLEGNGAKNPPYEIIAVLNTLKLLHLENFQQSEMTVDNTNFSYTQLTTLTFKTFHQLNSIAANAFSPLTSLEELNLENLPDNNVLQLSAILQLSKLKRIKIWETKIQQFFGSSFEILNDLQEIHIENNPNLITIDSNAFDGVNDTVQFLYLRENSLTNSLTFLTSMDWPVLTQLNLGYNNFGTIPALTFSRTPKLSYLDLSDTSLSTIQSSMFQGLTELHTLTLEYNIITSIQAGAFQTTPKLTDLKLSFQNSFSSSQILLTLDANAFDHIGTTLEHLSIGNNRIHQSTLWTNIAKLTNLKNLYMAKIGLHSIPDRAFANNVQLTEIDLSENIITSINQDTFYGPRTTLNMINLIGNKIETVDKCAISDFPTQPSLKLLANPVKCDCQLLWLFDWYHNILDNSEYFIQCAIPLNLQNQIFYDLTRTELVCSADYQEPICYDAYSTTTTSTTTTTTTTTTPTTTTTKHPAPFPIFSLLVAQQTESFIKLTWSINDRTELTGYKLEMISNNARKVIKLLHKEDTEYTFSNLDPGNYFTFCLILELGGVFQEAKSECLQGQTLEPLTTPPTTTTPAPFPIFSLHVAQQTENFIKLTWSINDRTELTGYKLEMISNNAPKVIKLLHKEDTEYTFYNLDPYNCYTFCLILQLGGVFQEAKTECRQVQTHGPLTTPTTSTTTTPAPFPIFSLHVVQQTEHFIKLTWSINDRTKISGYKLEMISNNAPKVIRLLNKGLTEYTFYNLDAGNYFTFCLILGLNGVFEEAYFDCEPGQTLKPLPTTTMASTVTQGAQNGQPPSIIG